MARKILITGGKGGVGKTTVTALLGICLARRGARVALVDTDFALGNLDGLPRISTQHLDKIPPLKIGFVLVLSGYGDGITP